MAAAALVGGLALSAAGTMEQVSAAHDKEAAQNTIIANQSKAEDTRHQSMLLDADRHKRELIRQGIIARSQALAVGTNQGAAFGSALPGSFGQISGGVALNSRNVNDSVALGTDIFNANKGVLQGRIAEAAADTKSAEGAGMAAMGSKIAGSATQLGSIASSFMMPGIG